MNFSGISSEKPLGCVLRLPLRLLPKRLVVPILQGPNRGLRWIVGSGTHGCWLGSYEPVKQQRIAEALQPGDVFYDVGANVGFYTLLASRVVGPSGLVVAFEPLPRNLVFLRRHVQLNRCGNVKVVEAAVSRLTGTKRFDPGTDPSSGRLSDEGAIEVRTVALDDLVTDDKQLPPPSVIKMDIEGGEVLALQGAMRVLAEYRPTIFLSSHGHDIHIECVQRLNDLGYEVEGLDGGSVDETWEIVANGVRRRTCETFCATIAR
jgi:FkbM family methyltransferase